MSFKEFIKLSWSKVILTIILLILGFFFTINFRDGDVVTAFGFPMILLAILLSYINNNCYAKSYTPPLTQDYDLFSCIWYWISILLVTILYIIILYLISCTLAYISKKIKKSS